MATMRRSKRQRTRREVRREKIVGAALRTFSRCGYRGATTRLLARAANITEVTLFRYFPTKEKLFGAVLDKYSILPILREQLQPPASDADARVALRSLGRRFMGVLSERQDIIRLMLSEAAINARQARMLFRQGPGRFVKDAARMLSRFYRRGKIRRVDFPLAARGLLGVFFSYVLIQEILFGKENVRVSLNRAADALSDMLWFGFRPSHSTRKGAKRP
jgi:AcrR family transcriptional regulator